MREFSASYHLRSERCEDAVELLRRANLKGYVFPPSYGWVTFLAADGTFKPDQKIVAATKHGLLHYFSAEDHGWGFTLFDQGKPACAYNCGWDPHFTVDAAKYSRAELERLVPFTDTILLDEFEQEMRPGGYTDVVGSEHSKTFARAVGLEHYDWVAYHYIERDFRFARDRRHDVTVVH
jgi:hypothetical protein